MLVEATKGLKVLVDNDKYEALLKAAERALLVLKAAQEDLEPGYFIDYWPVTQNLENALKEAKDDGVS